MHTNRRGDVRAILTMRRSGGNEKRRRPYRATAARRTQGSPTPGVSCAGGPTGLAVADGANILIYRTPIAGP